MSEYVSMTGNVVSEPEYFGRYTAVRIQSGEAEFNVIRLDPKWQLMDILFLRKGQTIDVEGVMNSGLPGVVVAYSIKITGYNTKKEIKTNGTEGFC